MHTTYMHTSVGRAQGSGYAYHMYACIRGQGPGSGLSPHSDNLNFLLVCHVGVRVPPGCRFRMHGEGDDSTGSEHGSERVWSPGKLLVADTSFLHSTTNESPTSRYVLHFSVWHPDLTLSEREGILRVHRALQGENP